MVLNLTFFVYKIKFVVRRFDNYKRLQNKKKVFFFNFCNQIDVCLRLMGNIIFLSTILNLKVMESVLAILGVFFVPAAMVVLIVWFKSKERGKRQHLQAELYAKALEKGQPIPADLFVEPLKDKQKRNPLNTGIICIAVGIGVALFIWMSGGAVPGVELKKAASLGIIPFFIGVAYVLIHFLEKGKNASEDAK